jgi:MraZ protein
MFLGQYQHSLDEKGRLTIPARFRELLNKGAYITQGFDKNLMVMTAEAFEQVLERITSISLTDPTARLLRRLILSNAYQVEVDKAGRILVPLISRQFLNLEGEATVVGQGEYFEIWLPADWDQQVKNLQDAEANAHRFSAFNLAADK